MYKIPCCAFVIFLSLTSAHAVFPQLALSEAGDTATIDFETTVSGVENGVFSATGFAPAPIGGQLDSDAWEVRGFSDGPLLFGGVFVTGDLARGPVDGSGVGTGGLYALGGVPGKNISALMVQPGGSDFTPGSITLKIKNEDVAKSLVTLTVSYDVLSLNDANRSNSLTFSYSTDNIMFTAVPALDFVSGEMASMSPVFTKAGGPGPSRTVDLVGLAVPSNGGDLYLRWEIDDVGGSGSRDEIAIDNISVSAGFLAPTAAGGSISGRIVDESGRGLRSVTVILASAGAAGPVFTTSNSFGFFGFRDLPTGESYILQVFSGRYSFDAASVVVTLQKDITDLRFLGRRFDASKP